MSARGQDLRDETLDEQLQEQHSTEQIAEDRPGWESAQNRPQRQPRGHGSHEEPSFAAARTRVGETMVDERGHIVENVRMVYRGSEEPESAVVNEVAAAAPQRLREHQTLTDANLGAPQSPSIGSRYTLAPAATNHWRASSPRAVPVATHEANPEREVQWPPALTAAALPPRPTPPWRGALAWRAQRPWPTFEHPVQAPQEGAGVVRTATAAATVGLATDSAVMPATEWDRATIDNVFAERLVQTLQELFNWRQREASDSEESLEDVPAAGLNVFGLRDVAGPGDDTLAVTQHQWSSLLDILPSDTQVCGSMMDSQGIPWGSDTSIRAAHHRQRIREYPNYTNVPDSLLARECDVRDTKQLQSCLLGGYGQGRCERSERATYDLRRWLQSGAPCAPPHSMVECSSKRLLKRRQVSHCHQSTSAWGYGAPMLPSYSVLECTRRVRPTVVHFQLRHLLRATSEDDVYLVQSNCLVRYCPSTHQVQCLLNLSGQTIYWSTGRMLGFATNALSRAFRERPPALRSTSRLGRPSAGRMRDNEAAAALQTHERVGADTVPAPETFAEHDESADATEHQAEASEVVYRKPPYPNDGLRVQVSTMSSDGWLCVAGGFAGEIIAVDCHTGSVCFDWRVAGNAENAITNYIELFYRAEASDPGSLGRARQMATANNDCFVRIFDLERCGHGSASTSSSQAILREIPFPWPVNHVTVQPLGSWRHPEPASLLAIAGDHTEVLLVHRETGERVMCLSGHRDYAFATAWHPNGVHLATGNQDGTFRIWDIRRTDAPLRHVFPARLGAVRSLQYSDDGRFLCVAEVADWVHIVDAFSGLRETPETNSSMHTDDHYLYTSSEGYLSETVIDVFGEIAGVSFSPARGEYLFVGISDPTYGCLMQYRRNRESYSLSRWIGF